MQQPIYWPAPVPSAPWTYQKAADSIALGPTQGNHPEQPLDSIFGEADRVADYQHYASDAIGACAENGLADMGAQMSFGGDLIENLNSLASDNCRDGFCPNWNNTYAQFAAGQKTSGGFPRLDLVMFTYHHVLLPLADDAAIRMELAIQRLAQQDAWGQSPTRGLFPAEMAFSERAIPALVASGVEWAVVSNSHISRACAGYPFTPHGDNTSPPNRADQTNPEQPPGSYFVQSIQRGCTTSNAAGLAYVPQRARYVDPATGNVTSLVVVPSAQAMSWDDGYSCYSPDDMQTVMKLAAATNLTRPPLFLLAHDGDNDFGGGYSYYTQCVPQLASAAAAAGIVPTTVEQYLAENPVPDDEPWVHVEDGAWVNKDQDFGSPQLYGWNWPLTTAAGGAGVFDIPGGWALNERNFAVIVAALSYVLHAESASGGVRVADVYQTSQSSTSAEIAWHFFLPSLTSGYMYYGSGQDFPVKQTIACNEAVAYAKQAMAEASRPAADATPPTVWTPQRLPWNPGGTGAGALWGWNPVQFNTTSFVVWSFAADALSGLASADLYYRLDSDGRRSIENDVFWPDRVYGAGSRRDAGLSDWSATPMAIRPFPIGNYFNQSIEMWVLPEAIADEIWVNVTGLPSETMVDYYLNVSDNAGNFKLTDLYHVWLGK